MAENDNINVNVTGDANTFVTALRASEDSAKRLASAIEALNANLAKTTAASNLASSATQTAAAAAGTATTAATASATATSAVGAAVIATTQAVTNQTTQVAVATSWMDKFSAAAIKAAANLGILEISSHKLGEGLKVAGEHGRTLSIAASAMGFETGEAAEKILAGMGAIVGSMKAAAGPFLVVATAALSVVGAISLFKESVSEAGKLQTAMNKLGVAVKTGGEDWKSLRSEVEEFVELQRRTTSFGSDEIISSLAKLKEAGFSLAEAYDTVRNAEDAAAATGHPLIEVTQALAQTYHGHTRALAALNLGTRETIKEGMTYKHVLDLLHDAYGGQAVGAINTYEGATKRLGEAVTHLKEDIGAELLPRLIELANKADAFVENFDEKKAAQIGDFFLAMINGITNTISIFAAIGKGFDDLFRDLDNLGNIMQNPITQAIKNLLAFFIELDKQIESSLRKIPLIGGKLGDLFHDASYNQVSAIAHIQGNLQTAAYRPSGEEIDKAIRNAAGGNKQLELLLQILAQKESGYATTLDKEGRGDADKYGHRHGYGTFQEDDNDYVGHTPKSQALLDKIRSDVDFGAKYAVAAHIIPALKAAGLDINHLTPAAVETAARAYNGSGPDAIAYGQDIANKYATLSRNMHLDNPASTAHSSEKKISGKTQDQLDKEAERERIKAAEEYFHVQETHIELLRARHEISAAEEEKQLTDLARDYAVTDQQREQTYLKVANMRNSDAREVKAEAKRLMEEDKKNTAENLSLAVKAVEDLRKKKQISFDDEIKGIQFIMHWDKLSAEQKANLEARITTLKKEEATQDEATRKKEEAAHIKAISDAETLITTQLKLGTLTRSDAEQQLYDIYKQYGNRSNSPEEQARAASAMSAGSSEESTDATAVVTQVNASLKIRESAIDTYTQIQKKRLELRNVVIDSAIAELQAEQIKYTSHGKQDDEANKKLIAGIEALKLKRQENMNQQILDNQATLVKQREDWDKYANHVTDILEKFIASGKTGFKGLAQEFKNMIYEMEKALLRSMILKYFFGVGTANSFGDLVSNAIGLNPGGQPQKKGDQANTELGIIGAVGGMEAGRTAANSATSNASAGIFGILFGRQGAHTAASAMAGNPMTGGGGDAFSIPGMGQYGMIPGAGDASGLMGNYIGDGSTPSGGGGGGLAGVGAFANLSKSPKFQAALAGIMEGQIFGGLQGGGSHSTWGSVGGAVGGAVGGQVGAAVGAAIGSLFGHADDPSKMPDVYKTQEFGQWMSNISGAQVGANGQIFNMDSSTNSASGGKGLGQEIAAYIANTGGTGLTPQEIADFKNFQQGSLKGLKDGIVTMADGTKKFWADWVAEAQDAQNKIALNGGNTTSPLFSVIHPFPDYANWNVSQTGTYTPTPTPPGTTAPTHRDGGNTGTGGPKKLEGVTVNVQGSVISEHDLAQHIRTAVGDAIASRGSAGIMDYVR